MSVSLNASDPFALLLKNASFAVASEVYSVVSPLTFQTLTAVVLTAAFAKSFVGYSVVAPLTTQTLGATPGVLLVSM